MALTISACGGATAEPSASGSTIQTPVASASGTPGKTGEGQASATPSPSQQVSVGVAGGEPNMAGFSDSRSFNAATWTAMAAAAKAQQCSVEAAEVEAMDRDAAIERTRAYLAAAVGESAMRAFEASEEAGSAAKAKTAAVAAAVTGNDAGALAAMLAAIGHEPDQPRHLVNAAALMPNFGLGSEAIALLDAAGEMGAANSTPYGLDQEAVAMNNRGRALLSLGRWEEAASVLEQAYAADDMLGEAAENLSLAFICLGRDDEAMRFARASRYREKPRMTERDGTSTPVPEDVYDMGLAVDDRPLLPTLHIPSTPGEGVALREWIGQVKQELLDRVIERSQRQMEVQGEVNAQAPTEMTRVRNSDILAAIASLSAPGGQAEAAWTDVTEASLDAFNAWDEHWGPSGAVEEISNGCSGSDDYDGCMRSDCIPATQAFHSAWMNHVVALDDLVREWAEVYHGAATAIAGHIGDPLQHELAVISIQGQLDLAFLDVVTRVEEVVLFEDNHRDTCVEGFAPVSEPYEPASPGAGEPCRMSTGAWTLQIAFISIQMECSDWSIEATTPGPIGAFISVSSKGGQTTIFAGPSGSASAGPFSAGSKSGFYVRSSATGATDFGYRVEPGSTSIVAGPVSMSGPALEGMDFSFVGIGAYLPGL